MYICRNILTLRDQTVSANVRAMTK